MKKLICLFLALLMTGIFCACETSSDASSSQSSASEETTSAEPEVSVPEILPEPTINGVKLSEFYLVYRESVDCAKFKTVAQDFAKYVLETYDIELNLRSERLVAKEHSIMFGLPNNYAACSDYRKDYGYGGYKMAVDGGNVILASSYANGCYYAAEEFKNLLSEQAKATEYTKIEITDTAKEGSRDIVKVACVGDSITQGINSKDNVNKIYPVYLQNMLGWDYFVVNAGLSGYSMVKTDPYAYCKSAQYNTAKKLEPDVVIFALGTNDANPGQDYKNWNAEGREELFLESTRELLDSFYDINPDCQIFLCYPASLFKVGNDQWNAIPWAEGIKKHVRPLLEQIVSEYSLPTVDFWDWSIENSYVFTDGLHPKDETYEPFAKHIYDNIKDTIIKP